MRELQRFSVSIDRDLLDRFDRRIRADGYPTRSKAIADLMRKGLVQRSWKAGQEVAAAILMVFDHHRRELVGQLTAIQHEYHRQIVSSQHIHLDHDNCLEIVVVRGKARLVEELAARLQATKGVQFCSLAAASTGIEFREEKEEEE